MANSIPSLKTSFADEKLIRHLFSFENCEPLNAALISKLIRSGWDKSVFEQVSTISSTAYYSQQRNSLLIPNEDNPDSLTSIEIEKNLTVHFHGLPRAFLA